MRSDLSVSLVDDLVCRKYCDIKALNYTYILSINKPKLCYCKSLLTIKCKTDAIK